jgi:hypothetical protein
MHEMIQIIVGVLLLSFISIILGVLSGKEGFCVGGIVLLIGNFLFLSIALITNGVLILIGG